VLLVRATDGVKVATVPEQITVPLTTVKPGPVSVKFVAGDVRVVQSIGSLKFAVSTCATGTPVAPVIGTVEMTVGTGVMVVNVQT
jgi:hypothetical protein